MKKYNITRLIIVFPVILFLFMGRILPVAARPVSVAVSILPQSFFVKEIGSAEVEILVMVPPGANPATYEPKPRQLAKLAGCPIYFAQGLPFESAWIPRFLKSNPHLIVVPTYAGIERVPMQRSSRSRGAKAEKNYLDPHIWLSPPLAFVEARNILEGLLRIDPSHKAIYTDGFRRLASKIVALDLEIRGLFEGVNGRNTFLVYHPAWGYFARTYGLKQVAIEKEGKKPLARDLKSLIQYAREKGFKELFIQPQVSAHTGQVIAQSIGARLVPLDPLAPQWDQNLLESAKKIRAALR
ncbi:MAG: cation ABC transporter substrate-binding protein [Deltaproteobacteria bacterium]|nr:MAG: cation ABC transporter substrate-binding protein [Deltaproteobacteria bacterium]